MNAYLLLANGMVFAGQSVGAEGVTVGEVVFATGMVGFQETLTDPSYYGQIITQTYPLIGNYGMNKDDMESDKIWAKGYIVREACQTPSNWRCEETLDAFRTINVLHAAYYRIEITLVAVELVYKEDNRLLQLLSVSEVILCANFRTILTID